MSTQGQFNAKNPTIKRILKEAAEMSTSPPSHIHAAPLESNMFEWHFTIRGPPAPSAFSGGIYHGRIVLPPTYPLRPPSFRFLTPSGRFEVNREICLSISGHHEESWQPAWGIRTALVAIRSFMDTEAKGQLGGVDASEAIRKRLANESSSWKCPTCKGGSNADIMASVDADAESRLVEPGEASARRDEQDKVPAELRLGYRDEMTGEPQASASSRVHATAPSSQLRSRIALSAVSAHTEPAESAQASLSPNTHQHTHTHAHAHARAHTHTQTQTAASTGISRPARRTITTTQTDSKWLDMAIVGVSAMLALLIIRKLIGLFMWN